MPHYSIVIRWSDEDGIDVVSLPEWGDLIHTHGATYDEALQQGKELLGALIATRRDAGQPLPEPRVFASA
jgi:predicted RNase H-like HicB family nuclease